MTNEQKEIEIWKLSHGTQHRAGLIEKMVNDQLFWLQIQEIIESEVE